MSEPEPDRDRFIDYEGHPFLLADGWTIETIKTEPERPSWRCRFRHRLETVATLAPPPALPSGELDIMGIMGFAITDMREIRRCRGCGKLTVRSAWPG